jgi:2-oxoglutarate dehydrogenase E2 component (dihydrolipoamide succinyltransferase)
VSVLRVAALLALCESVSLSTPVHNIEQRAMVVDGKVEARPVMFLALTYDHRLIDGRDAVTFLRSIKFAIEDPTRLLLDL